MSKRAVTAEDLVELLGVVRLGPAAERELRVAPPLVYREVSSEERRTYESRVTAFLASNIEPSGVSYQERWNNGWSENLSEFRENPSPLSLVPKFVRQGLPIRYQGRWVMPLSSTFETDFVHVLRAHLVDQHLTGIDTVVEFGAGTGHNLVHLHHLGIARVIGFDWSEPAVKLMNEVGQTMGIPLESFGFDMFEPAVPDCVNFGDRFAVLTIGAMEQLGLNWQAFLQFLMQSGAQVVLHLETNYEDLNEGIPFEAMPREYIRKRNWLRGYFSALKSLSSEGAISGLNVTRTFGSFFHDGYTLTTWSPSQR